MKKVIAVLLICLLFTVSASATSWIEYKSVEALMDAANLVVVGTCVGSAEIYRDNVYGHEKLPYTVSSIEVTEVIKGNVQAGETIVEAQPNHRDPKPDDPVVVWENIWFEAGQEYLLFLRVSDSSPYAAMINPMQGHYIIDNAGNLIAHPYNRVPIASLDDLLKPPPKWLSLPTWLQWILRWICFGWLWMN